MKKYIDREINICEIQSISEISEREFCNKTILFLSKYKNENILLDVDFIKQIIVKNPLGIMFFGDNASKLFDISIEYLNSRIVSRQIMTRICVQDQIYDAIEEFFTSFWPSEDRFDSWNSYFILNCGYEQSEIEQYISRFCD
jgi:hypothetical protein